MFQLFVLLVVVVCLVAGMPAPDYAHGGYGHGGHGHGHATSYQNYVLHSYHPVKVHVGHGHGHHYDGHGHY